MNTPLQALRHHVTGAIERGEKEAITASVIQIWEDLHNERAGFYRAFWCGSPNATTGSPVIGHCSPGGSHRSIRAAAREALRLYPGERIYRNGKEVLRPGKRAQR